MQKTVHTRDYDVLCSVSKSRLMLSACPRRYVFVCMMQLVCSLWLIFMFCPLAEAKPLDGELVGTLAATNEDYVIAKTISVPFGETATIQPGVRLCFAPGAMLVVEGFLIAEGEKGNPVTFSSCERGKDWGGIRFRSSKRVGERINRLSYSIVEYANRAASSEVSLDPESNGGGLAFENSDAEIDHSVVRFNAAANGGGIYIGANSNVSIEYSAVYANKAVGSNYIYSGGGGIYIDGSPAAQVSLVRNIIGLNRFIRHSYSNEEGGGGLYVQGGQTVMQFNLFLANRSGKGPGALINALQARASGTTSASPFYGNMFIANQGGFNFEQVAVQTRYSFEKPAFTDVWDTNAGQFPFVAHLNRNSLVRYLNYGQKLSLADHGHGRPSFSGFLAEARRPRSEVVAVLSDRSGSAPTCGEEVQFGPVDVCDNLTPGLQGYVARLAEVIGDPTFDELAKEALGVTSSQAAKDWGVLALDFATADPGTDGGPRQQANLPELFARVVAGTATAEELLIDLRSGRSTDARGFSPALWAFSLGYDDILDALAAAANDDDHERLLQKAIAARFEDAALRVLVSGDGRKPGIPKRALYANLIDASRYGHSRLVRALLDRGLDPNFPYMGQYPLAAAAEEGHVDTVLLLLRRGAIATPPPADPASQFGRPLDTALTWYHLGGGFKEIAELLIAAGGEIKPELRSAGEHVDPLLLKSWVEAGFSTDDPRWPVLLAEASQNAGSDFFQNIYRDLAAGQAKTDPVVVNIRKWRGHDLDSLLKAVETSEDDNELIALYRIIESRRFSSMEIDAQVLWGKYDGSRHPLLVQSVRLEAVLTLYQDGAVDVANKTRLLPSKGATPRPAGDSVGRPPELPYKRKIAIVVGVSDYKNLPSRAAVSSEHAGLTDLRYADKDASDIAQAIRQGRLGDGWEIIEFTGPRAGKIEVDAALATVNGVEQNDLVLFFFSGHGLMLPGASDQAFLLLQDSDPQEPNGTALRLRQLREWAIGLKARHVVLILDACHAGLVGNAKGAFGDFSYRDLEAKQQKFDAGKIALTASLGGALSYEDPKQENGFFTSFLLQTIRGELVRPAGASFLSVREIIGAITERLPGTVRGRLGGASQTPNYIWLEGSDLLDFPLIPLL
ncbi:hypothetical protein HFO38_30500 [Rhizobium leguminosarum]|uniref:caspase family protein n=1 Tax=Rhizobium leguminosarum TaxID=384 RepID=UPI001C98AEDE|nr:caspase family protein [Rhizobium leguminosarum]MBY5706981.1 hypothetical protein [Rhizobium leguminosarum]